MADSFIRYEEIPHVISNKISKQTDMIGVCVEWKLIKVVFRPNSESDLICYLFKEEQFKVFLQKKQSVIKLVYISGSVSDGIKSILRENGISNCIQIFDKDALIIKGYKIIIESVHLDSLKTKYDVKHDDQPLKSAALGQLKQYLEKVNNDDKNDDKQFPCLICLVESSIQFIYFDENGHGHLINNFPNGLRNFLGLSKCLLDINNYDKLIKLADRGTRKTYDTLLGDVLESEGETPYSSNIPKDFPLFFFGRFMDDAIDEENIHQPDIARSLCAMFAFQLLSICGQVCRVKKMGKVYMSGDIFHSTIFQYEMRTVQRLIPILKDIHTICANFSKPIGVILSATETQQ